MPFCPLSRKIVFALREKGLLFQEHIEKTWAPSDALLKFSPRGTLPVLIEGSRICSNDYVACEYLEDAYAPSFMGESLEVRIKVRSILSYFDGLFYQDVYQVLFHERALNHRMGHAAGPNTDVLRKGRATLRACMSYLNGIAGQDAYLAGKTFSWADISAAAHLSCIDYLGDIPWEDFPEAKEWYGKIKSRPTFRPFLAQDFPGLEPAPHYGILDF